MTRKMLAVRAMAGMLLSVLAFLPNNLVRLTPVAFAQDQDGLSTMSRWEKQGGFLLTSRCGNTLEGFA